MEHVGYAAAIVVGLALGLFCGRLLNAVYVHWESAATAVKASRGLIAFLLGGGGGAVIFHALSGSHEPTFYLLALGLGMLAAFFFAKVPPRYSLQTFRHVIRLSEALRDEVPDPEARALLILSTFAPPRMIEEEAGMDQAALAGQLERATDALGASTEQSSRSGS